MSTVKTTSHLDLNYNQLLNALLHPVSIDPASPVNGQAWVNTSEGRLKLHVGDNTVSLALTSDVTAGAITGQLWNAQSAVVATADNTPTAVVIPAGGFLGRPTGGNVGALSTAQAKTVLGIPSGSVANQAYVDSAINALKGAVPAQFDTLIELLAEIQSNESALGTITAGLAQRTRKYSAEIGDGSATIYTLNHGLATEDVTCSVRPSSGGSVVIAEWEPVSSSAIELRFNAPPTTNQYRVVVIG